MPHFEPPVRAITFLFAVMVGVAMENFLRKPPPVVEEQHLSSPGLNRVLKRVCQWLHIVDKERSAKEQSNKDQDLGDRLLRDLFYLSSFLVLASVSLRFVIGCEVHLHYTYVSNSGGLYKFVKDLVFLVFFGVILVKVAFSKTVFQFNNWLILFSVLGILWSLIEFETQFGRNWFWVNLVQLIITACTLCATWLTSEKRKWFANDRRNRSWYVLATFVVLAGSYTSIFVWDLKGTIEISSGDQEYLVLNHLIF